MALLYQDKTEQRQAVYTGKPIRIELGEVTLSGTTGQEIEAEVENMLQAGNALLLVECTEDDSGSASTEVVVKYAPRIQRLNETLEQSAQALTAMHSTVIDLSATTQPVAAFDIPLFVSSQIDSQVCMTPFGAVFSVAGEASSDAKLALSLVLY